VTLLIAFVPVLLLLTLLQLMDSFRLVRLPVILSAIGYGAVAAFGCLYFHDWLLNATGLQVSPLTRYVAPVSEEVAKGAFIVLLLWKRRIAFLVDAAVLGFAVGTGFALAENIDYLRDLDQPTLTLWLVRGLGTAVLHGATTAIFAIVARTLSDRWVNHRILSLVPGLGLAVVIHSAFNHLLLPPLAMTLLLIAILPLVTIFVFQRSEQATREWIGAGLDLDIELLGLVCSEGFAFTRFASYLKQLRARFGGLVVADMFCLLRVELELSVQAKAMLMARQHGLEVPVTDDLRCAIEEIDYLRSSIGRTGRLALQPLQVTSDRDRWHRYLLQQSRRAYSPSSGTRSR
jgi:RsiW-degrading membrane proteinase PrsW (M82 family)